MGNQAPSAGGKDNLEGRDVRSMDRKTSEALALGVKYNMKILLRGEVLQKLSRGVPLPLVLR